MKLINFTEQNLTPEEIEKAKNMGVTEIINVPNPLRFNPENINSSKIVDDIAEEISKLVGNDKKVIVHFPVSWYLSSKFID